MRVLIVGANGLIGSAVAARLASSGATIVAATRGGDAAGLVPAIALRIDVAQSTDPSDWLPHLRGVDAVVNCAGVLQDSPWESTAGVHINGIGALFKACEAAGVRRVIHFSAIGVDRETPTEFSRTKLAGDAVLTSCDLDWVILRPAVVIGRAAYGASALMRGLAALPVAPLMPGTGDLQLVHLDDVVETVMHFLRPDAPSREIVQLVGPKRWSFEQSVSLLRQWMRWPPARQVPLPDLLGKLLYRTGDLIALLGWRPPVRSTARREVMRGAVGDPAQLLRLGIRPRDIEAALRAEPASVQERWFASLYCLKPLLFGVIALFWITTGLISLGPGWEHGMALMREGGVGERIGALTVLAGALSDICIGAAVAYRRTSRLGLYAAITIALIYATIGTILVPRLWADPLGPMLKIWPIIVLHLVALGILDDR
jgi:uncharacterized protein YbjT (DUF2867 family)